MKTTEEKFWDRVKKQGDCLIWTGTIDNAGIGRFRCDGLNISARQFAYSLIHGINGPIFIQNQCGNSSCVLVSHLIPGDRQPNPKFDGLICQIEGCDNPPESRGSSRKPRRICSLCRRKGLKSLEPDPRIKMTPEILEVVLELYDTGITQLQIGKKLGLSVKCIQENIAKAGKAPGKGRGTVRLYPETPEGFKWCNKCKEPKVVDEFWSDKSSWDGLAGACKDCMAKQHKLNRASMRHLAKKVYGLTLEEYDLLMAATPNCPICGDSTTDLDHNGETGQLRSPLCGGCNRGLGQFSHDPERLRKAADYMEEYH